MNFKTLVWKGKLTRAWFLVTIIVMVILFTVTMIATQNRGLRNMIYLGIGGPSAILGEERGIFTVYYETKEDVLEVALALNKEIAEEGFVLLRNENNSLPLNRGANVSVLGRSSVDLLYGVW